MQIIRKSPDGNAMIVRRSTGYSVSIREKKWTTDLAFRGTQTVEWHCVGKELLLPQAEALFALYVPAQAA